MTSLSIAIVCKNNERTIGPVLDAARALLGELEQAGLGSGEIVAVDSGSTDRTIEMLQGAGARVVHSPWLGHVRTKQLAMDESRGPWVLALDSDEPPQPDLRASIVRAMRALPPDAAGYRVNRKIHYRGRYLEHAWQPEWRLRLVRKDCCAWTGADPHDRIDLRPDAPARLVLDLAGTLRHDSFETFAEHLAKQVAHSRTSAASLHALGVRSSYWKLVSSPAGAFLKQIIVKSAWRDGVAGWLAAGSTAAGALMKHMMLLELGSPARPPKD